MAKGTLASVKSAVAGSKDVKFQYYLTFHDIIYHYGRCLAPLAENNRVLNAVVALNHKPFVNWPELKAPQQTWIEIVPTICGMSQTSRYSMALTELSRPGWTQLYSALGHILVHILTRYAVFAEVDSFAVLQITGEQLLPIPRPAKRQKIEGLTPALLAARCAQPETRPENGATREPRLIFGSLRGQSRVAVMSMMPLIYRAETRLKWATTSTKLLSSSSRHLKQKVGLIYHHFAPPNCRKDVKPSMAGRFVFILLQLFVSSKLYDSSQNENTAKLLKAVCFPFAPLNLKTSAIQWLFPSSNKFAHQAQLRLASVISNWLLSLAAEIYTCYFHVTTAKYGNIVIFRRSVWNRIVSEQLNLFKARLIPAKRVGGTYCKIKLIPKSEGARILILVKDDKNELTQARQLLDGMLAQKATELLPDCATLAPRLAEFASRFEGQATFWLAKVDISRCYDTIDLVRLRQALNDWQGSQLLEQGFSIFESNRGKQVKRALPSGGLRNWKGLISERRQQPLMLTWNIIKSTLFKQIVSGEINIGMSNRTYHLKTGIPQGSKISMPLANLYLGALAVDCLASYLADPHCLLLRYVDDWLLVSTSEQKARDFAALFANGFPKWNMKGNPEKAVVSNTELSYLGYFIDAKSLNVLPRLPNRQKLKSICSMKMLVSEIYSPAKTLITAFIRQNQQPPKTWIHKLFVVARSAEYCS